MALGTGLRGGRRMAKIQDRPLGRGMAGGTVGAEKADVTVFGLMAVCAVEQ